MKKITLSFYVLAAIITVTILQGCAKRTLVQCAEPTLSPSPSATNIPPVRVTITTATKDCYLRYTINDGDPSGSSGNNGTQIPGPTGVTPDVFGRTLKAIAYKPGVPGSDSPIVTGQY